MAGGQGSWRTRKMAGGQGSYLLIDESPKIIDLRITRPSEIFSILFLNI